MNKIRTPPFSLIVLTLLLSACNLPFGNSVATAVDTPLATLELPPTLTQPQQPDITPTPSCTDPAGCP